MINDIELLQAQNKLLTKQLAEAKASSVKLEGHILRQAVMKSKLLQERTLDPEGVATKLVNHFEIDHSSSVLRIIPKEPMISLKGGRPDVEEAVTDILLTKYKDSLLPELPASKEDSNGDKQPSQAKNADLDKLKAAYKTAKVKGDGTAMISIKRQLAQAGFGAVIL